MTEAASNESARKSPEALERLAQGNAERRDAGLRLRAEIAEVLTHQSALLRITAKQVQRLLPAGHQRASERTVQWHMQRLREEEFSLRRTQGREIAVMRQPQGRESDVPDDGSLSAEEL